MSLAAHPVGPGATAKTGARLATVARTLGTGAAVVPGLAVVAASASTAAGGRESGAGVPGAGSVPSAGPGSGLASSGRAAVSTAADLFSQIDAGEAGAPQWLHAGPRSMEVGVEDPTHGWLEIRATGSSGQVAASLTAASAEAHAGLHAQLAGMAGYLAQHEIGVHHLTMSGGAGEATAGSGERSGRQGAQPDREGSSQDQAGSESSVNRASPVANEGEGRGFSGPVARTGVSFADGKQLPRISAGEGPPHMVNVRA